MPFHVYAMLFAIDGDYYWLLLFHMDAYMKA